VVTLHIHDGPCEFVRYEYCADQDRPGAGGIALGVLQAGAQIGGAIQLKSATANCLARANQEMFNPLGLEVL
jgi:hypothetical protein